MADSDSTEIVDVSGIRWRAWSGEGGPPIIMNPNASTHALISWCWGEADHALQMSIAGSMSCEGYELAKLNDAIQGRLESIAAVLEALAIRTKDKTCGELRLVRPNTND